MEEFMGPGADLERMRGQLAQAAEKYGVPFQGADRLYNTRLAQELALWAAAERRGDEFLQSVYRAYFVEGKDISSPAVLARTAASVGLSAGRAAEILEMRTFSQAVDADWALSEGERVRVVPTLILGGDRLTGAQSHGALVEFLEKHGVAKKANAGG